MHTINIKEYHFLKYVNKLYLKSIILDMLREKISLKSYPKNSYFKLCNSWISFQQF